MPLRLTLIAHASTKALRQARFPSRDEPLDDLGRADALRATPLPSVPDRAFHAPERRTAETAAALGLSTEPIEILRDWNYGRWAGFTLADVQNREPEAVAAWLSDPESSAHGGETLNGLLERVGDWLEGLAPRPDEKRGSRLIAVTHPAVIRAAVVHALRASADSFWRIDIAPLSRTDLTGEGPRWSLRALLPFERN